MDFRYSIKIFEKGGVPYRHYTPESLEKLFLESKTAANFEVMALIEGLTNFAYFLYCNLTKQKEKYDEVLKDQYKGSFKSVIDYINESGIIDSELKEQLHEYRKMRNEVMHNWLQLKTPLNPDLDKYSHEQALNDLYILGMKVLGLLHRAVTPSHENWEEYTKKFTTIKS